jgi:hypothetical protein
MIDEERPLADGGNNDALLYDWFKHLTTMSLLTLGGILSLSESADDGEIKTPILAGIVIVVATAGVLSFSGAAQLIKAKAEGEPLPKQVQMLQKSAPVILSAGVGAFLYLFMHTMG